MNETHLPITSICLVAKPNNVPTGFHCIRKGKEKIILDDRSYCQGQFEIELENDVSIN
jgi:hypothetical protein